MIKAILITVIIVLALIGLSDIIRSFNIWILSSGKRQYLLAIIPCKGQEDNLEYTVKSIYSRLKWQSCCQDCRIVLADFGMTEETKQTAELLANKTDGLLTCDKKELSDWLFEKFQLQIEAE